jgi:hypothetical protein
MREVKSLSYSGLSLWESRPDEFYLTRLAERRSPRQPQEHPAAVGSAFDARVKSTLYAELKLGSDPKYTYEALFEAQVEPQNRDWAGPEGDYVFDSYVQSEFYTDLLDYLKVSNEAPRFEFTVEAVIAGVPFTAKPDLRWMTPLDVHVIHDWKVNGYCSKNLTSPCKSYMRVKDGFIGKPSRGAGREHNEFLAYQHRDLIINTTYLEVSSTKWADQLSMYGWSLGEKIGDENVVLSVHQIVAKPNGLRPLLRVASYRARVAAAYQQTIAARLKRCWDSIQTGHIFADVSREESDEQCKLLDNVAEGLQSTGSEEDIYFNEVTRARYRG